MVTVPEDGRIDMARQSDEPTLDELFASLEGSAPFGKSMDLSESVVRLVLETRDFPKD
jgi:hypothetical protein